MARDHRRAPSPPTWCAASRNPEPRLSICSGRRRLAADAAPRRPCGESARNGTTKTASTAAAIAERRRAPRGARARRHAYASAGGTSTAGKIFARDAEPEQRASPSASRPASSAASAGHGERRRPEVEARRARPSRARAARARRSRARRDQPRRRRAERDQRRAPSRAARAGAERHQHLERARCSQLGRRRLARPRAARTPAARPAGTRRGSRGRGPAPSRDRVAVALVDRRVDDLAVLRRSRSGGAPSEPTKRATQASDEAARAASAGCDQLLASAQPARRLRRRALRAGAPARRTATKGKNHGM